MDARRPVVSGDRVYVSLMYRKRGFTESSLFAFDLASGEERWARTLDHFGNEPVAADGGVYWSSFEGSVHALNREGELLWKAPGTEASIGIPVLGTGDRLLVGEIAGGARSIWCLDRKTGATLWRFEHGGHAYRLCHSAGRVFHTSVGPSWGGRPPTLYCLSEADGGVVWSVTDPEYMFNPIVRGGMLFIGTHHQARLYSADRGTLLAAATLEDEKFTHNVAPCSDERRLIVWREGRRDEPHALSAVDVRRVKPLFRDERFSLDQRWKIEEPRGLCEAPIALPGDRLLYLTHDGSLCVIDEAGGERLSETSLKTKRATFGGLAVSGSQLVATHGREVLAFPLGDVVPG